MPSGHVATSGDILGCCLGKVLLAQAGRGLGGLQAALQGMGLCQQVKNPALELGYYINMLICV